VSVIDTQPISPASDWASLAKHLVEDQPARAAAARERLRHPAPQPRTAAEDVAYYTELLTVPAVQASRRWTEDVEARLKTAQAKVDAAEENIRAARLVAARLMAGAR
jgi:hypothetical protein